MNSPEQEEKKFLDGVTFRRKGALIDRAAELLTRGPLPTHSLAEQVLRINGRLPAAARAVWTLLADDDRFCVDQEGVWSLKAALSAERSPVPLGEIPADLRKQRWAVVDVETTGGSPARGHRVTEIAVVHVDGNEVGDVFSTLVYPGRRIPRSITRITGIDDAMVADAPRFGEVASRVSEALEGRIFVAHNASFDWRFVSAEFQRATMQCLAGRRLCTVRLARKLLPHLPSRSLDAMATYFDLQIPARHRAADDAVATAHLLLRLMGMLEDRQIHDWQGVDALLRQRAPRRKRTSLPRSMDSA